MKHRFLSLTAAAALLSRAALAAPVVYAIDDGEKIKRDAGSLPFQHGLDNPVWAPGQPIRLASLRGETVAFQIVIQGDAKDLDGVTVDLDQLTAPHGTIRNTASATDPTNFVGRPIERFVEHYVEVKRRSATNGSGTSLGWAGGSGPPDGAWTGWMPDALIPVEVAPSWAPYPMHVGARQNGVVWIDLTIPAAQPAGLYTGDVVVKACGHALATLPVELTVHPQLLPDRAVDTMLYYDRLELDRRIGGGDAAEGHLFKLLRRHHLTAMHSAHSVADLQRQIPALDGTLYSVNHGYEGPGQGDGDGLLSLGTYGQLGAPDAASVATVASLADALEAHGLLSTMDTFVYAVDETCGSPLGQAWRDALAGSPSPNARRVKVGWTCSTPPASQPVDIPMVIADAFDVGLAGDARAAGKDVWIYNGARPHSGTTFTDSPAVDPRVNGWISAFNDVGRWFYWETTFWYDGNRGGQGPYDPFATAETFHNADGDEAQGEGVLLYPGKQVDRFTAHSVGLDGVIASIRLKNLRRGVEDAGYYRLAAAVDPVKARAIARALLPRVLSSARGGDATSWSSHGKPFFDARSALLALLP